MEEGANSYKTDVKGQGELADTKGKALMYE